MGVSAYVLWTTASVVSLWGAVAASCWMGQFHKAWDAAPLAVDGCCLVYASFSDARGRSYIGSPRKIPYRFGQTRNEVFSTTALTVPYLHLFSKYISWMYQNMQFLNNHASKRRKVITNWYEAFIKKKIYFVMLNWNN